MSDIINLKLVNSALKVVIENCVNDEIIKENKKLRELLNNAKNLIAENSRMDPGHTPYCYKYYHIIEDTHYRLCTFCKEIMCDECYEIGYVKNMYCYFCSVSMCEECYDGSLQNCKGCGIHYCDNCENRHKRLHKN
jgi:hypothetical protein